LTDTSRTAEGRRLEADARRLANWKRWGPYLSERQWGTVREDYSADGGAWEHFPHDHARSRAYRWGEDGLLGITDRECRLAFALALWNGKDPFLKERLFGLTNPQGNHGEDVKELYYYLDSTPTHSYMKALYKYPLARYPYERLVEESRRRGFGDPELEIADTGAFDGGYADVFAEYAKAGPDDVLVRVTVANRGEAGAVVHVLPTLWFRNTWSWGRTGEGYWPKPRVSAEGGLVVAEHASLGRYALAGDAHPGGEPPELLFTENETNTERLYGVPNASPWVKDAFHDFVVAGRREAVNPGRVGTKAAALYRLALSPGESAVLRLRLQASEAEAAGERPFAGFDAVFEERRREADAFFAAKLPLGLTDEERRVARQGDAGLLWTKQYYHYVVRDWLEGDPAPVPAPPGRRAGRNADWGHLHNRDVVSMPDKWEYPWYAAWDLAFHMIPFAALDPHFAKEQLVLFLREWYMHPNGELPAYEWNLADANPPVHAWACWRVYKLTAGRGERDRLFLARVFHKLLLNFTWWVNRKDRDGKNLFSGGFLGLDNIGVFDRSKPLPGGGHLEQADATSWMAFYCSTMLAMALELADGDPAYEDVASKFFEHFVAIADAMNHLGGHGLWDEEDGFYYDELHAQGRGIPLKVRSLVGLTPLFAAEILDDAVVDRLPGFKRRLLWFLENRKDLARHIAYCDRAAGGRGLRLLAIPSRERLLRVLRTLLDEQEFLSPHGIRSLSRAHAREPYRFFMDGEELRVSYVPGESDSGLFGGNSNWRGPVWLPVNYLLVEALDRYHHFYGDRLTVELPTGSGRQATLCEVARELESRLVSLFLPDASGGRPCHGDDRRYAEDPHFRDLVLFHEYFHGDDGRGLGASHQTGWTALAVRLLEHRARARRDPSLRHGGPCAGRGGAR
jgi:hypothetical protein